jgi:hypothetical protein
VVGPAGALRLAPAALGPGPAGQSEIEKM